MSEIEKMYENAGFIRKQCKDYSCTVCEQYKTCEKYPTFTAEKQIAILCWLVNLKGNVTFNNKPKDITPERLQVSLACAINQYWDGLTPEEKQQVKGILE